MNYLWDQAENSLRRFTIGDYIDHDEDGLVDRLPRWKDKFSQMPRYPEVKKSSKFRNKEILKPHPLQALNGVEHAKDMLLSISHDDKTMKIEDVKKKIKVEFPSILEDDIDYI